MFNVDVKSAEECDRDDSENDLVFPVFHPVRSLRRSKNTRVTGSDLTDCYGVALRRFPETFF